jgi:hypothetical protein
MRLFSSKQRRGRFSVEALEDPRSPYRGNGYEELPSDISLVPDKLPRWTSMACVLYWLRRNGKVVRCQRQDDGTILYIVDNRFFSTSQILCLTNRLRRAQNVPIFYVQDITQM